MGSYTFETDPLTYVSLCRNQEAILALLTSKCVAGVTAAKPPRNKLVVKMNPENGNRLLYAGTVQLGDIDEWLESGWTKYESDRQLEAEEDETEKCKNQAKPTAKESDEESSEDSSEGESKSEDSDNHSDGNDSVGTSSSEEVEVVKKPATSQKGKREKQQEAKPIPIKLGVRTWEVDEDTDGENAYGSDNEIPLNQTLLKDIVP
eukprot:scaffold225043_cov60-Cyclotella_meneghiniana.AAC.1